MSFESPFLLVTLGVPALVLAAYLWLERRPARYAVEFPNLAVLASVTGRSQAWRRHLTAAFVVSALVALGVALARPAVTMSVPSERATVVLALDVSGSMLAEDVEPTRIGAARAAIERFLERLPERIRVGLVLFTSEPSVVAPPTRDRQLVRDGLSLGAPGFGTAIGDAAARAAELAREAVATADDGDAQAAGRRPPAAIVFLSDGFQTRGVLTPEQGAQRAAAAGIPLHTIALGTDEGVIEVERFGERQLVPVPPDRPTLARMAAATGGKAFEVDDAGRLSEVYESLGSSVGRVPEPREVTVAFVAAGAALLAVAGALAGLWAPRLP